MVVAVRVHTITTQPPVGHTNDVGLRHSVPAAVRIGATLSHAECDFLNRVEGYYMRFARLQAAMPEGVTVVTRTNLRFALDVAWNPRTETLDMAVDRAIEAYNAAMASLRAPSVV